MAKGKSKKGPDSSEFLSNTIVVKLHDYVNIPYTVDTEMMEYLKPQFGTPLTAMLNKYKETNIGRLITSITPQQIDTLVSEAEEYSKKWSNKSPYLHNSSDFKTPNLHNSSDYKTPNFHNFLDYKIPKLHNFLKIECKKNTPADELVNLLKAQKIVEDAFIQGWSSPASRPSRAKSLIRRQGYLNAAPRGINAKYAWRHGGGGSGNFKFIDIEDGWDYINTPHEDLPDCKSIPLVHGINGGSPEHGNQVLGVILAKDNRFGIKGIAPSVNASVVSQYPVDVNHQNPANAVAFATAQLKSGDILLLELQYNGLRNGLIQFRERNDFPLELHPCVFHFIKIATMRGVIVVEPAGNAGKPLDHLQYFNRNTHDSGAIMVAAATASVPHRRKHFSNYGKRIDCYAWGEKIVSTTAKNGYAFDFKQTSGAAAIIAGAVISVQSMNIARTGNKLDSLEMRRILSDANNGTSSPDPKLTGAIMPDLKKIAKKIMANAATAAAPAIAPMPPIPPIATVKVLKTRGGVKKISGALPTAGLKPRGGAKKINGAIPAEGLKTLGTAKKTNAPAAGLKAAGTD